MPSQFVNEDIKQLLNQIIEENNVKNIKDIKYREGSQAGDGYVSKTVAVEISHPGGVFRVFFKYARDIKFSESVPIDQLYANEIFFYDIVYPAFVEFLRKKRAEGAFTNVPKCYGTSEKSGIVALENIKDKGYVLHNRKEVMHRPQLELVLKTFARFHAASYAFKDQEKEKYKELLDNSYGDFFSKIMDSPGPVKMVARSIEAFLEKLDPIKDKCILEKCVNLVENMTRTLTSPRNCPNEYSILTQGDCWCNNMMFLYPEEDPNRPERVILIDWQLLRYAPPVFDIAYFFYTIASKEALDDINRYLKLYHDELTRRLKDLGSDPEILYPFRILKEQWKQYGKYGFAMAFMLVRMMLCAENEIVNMEGVDFENEEDVQKMYPKIRQEDEFVRRMKILAEHFIENDWL